MSGTIVITRDASEVQVVNTTTETPLFEYELPAYIFGSDKAVRLVLRGDYLNNTASNQDIRIRIYLGATLMWDDTVSQNHTSARAPWLVDAYVMELGTATQLLHGFVNVSNNGGTPATVGEGHINSATAPALVMGSAAEDETTALTLSVTVTLGVADAAFDFTKVIATLELL